MEMQQVMAICESIPGWMYPAELQWLYEQARSRPYIVEIGVYQGRSTVALAAGTPGHVIGIDSWEGGPKEREVWHPEFATAEGRDAVYLAAWQNLRERPVTLLRVDSARAWTVLKAEIDMLFHDGRTTRIRFAATFSVTHRLWPVAAFGAGTITTLPGPV